MRTPTMRACRDGFWALSVVTVASLAGLAAAPRSAGAAVQSFAWSCYGSDSCHGGTSQCCFEIEIIQAGEGRCSTMCSG
jgi:hypothetical protein